MNRYVVLLIALVPATACDDGGDDAPDDSESTTVATAGETEAETDSEGVVCDEAPVINYDTFGRGFLDTYCNGCHGAGAADRQGAPEMVVFDDAAGATQWGPRIQARVFPVGQMPPMPPAGGVPEGDLDRAQVWLECYP